MALKNNEINPRLIEINGRPILAMDNKTNSDMNSFKLDREWVKQAFLLNDIVLGNKDDIINRYWSSASNKFTDTRLGGNIGMNSRPQFTRYSDIRDKGKLAGRNDVNLSTTEGNYGMGRYYSEAIDDPSQTIYMSFGVPQYNSLTSFISKAFDRQQVALARTGRGTSLFYDVAYAAGTISTFIAFPAIAITIAAGRTISSLFVRPTSKFYTLKPTMRLYWLTVNVLVNTIAINKGIFPKILADDGSQKIGNPFKLDEDYLEKLSELLPTVFKKAHFFDMEAISLRAQVLANRLLEDEFNQLNKGTATDFTGYVKKNITGDGTHSTPVSDNKGEVSLLDRLRNMAKFTYYKAEEGGSSTEINPNLDENGQPKKDQGWLSSFKSWFNEAKEDTQANFNDGNLFAVFKVDHTGSVQESFGNSVVESDLSQKLNSQSSQARETRFTFAEGNIGPDIINSAVGAIGDVAKGVLDGVTMDFSTILAGLGGSGYIDIPKHWQSSSAQLPRVSYTMSLLSPYGNSISQMQNIYIPLCMLLAGSLPLSTGKQSYTSPYLCQIFDRGRCQIRLGMIESLSITRGTTNTPFNLSGAPLGVDVSFSVVDLSSLMHMPISNGTIGDHKMTLDEDNILSDYLAVLANQSIDTQIYSMPKAKLTAAKLLMQKDIMTSPAHWSAIFHEETTTGILKYTPIGVAANIYEGIQRGNSLIK
jgi:hypothetical protein